MKVNNKQINTSDYWEIDRFVYEPTGKGTEEKEYAYVINRFTGEVKKVEVGFKSRN